MDKLLNFKNEKTEINNYQQRGLSPQKNSNYDSRSYLTLFMFPSFDHSGELELLRRRNIAPPASYPPIRLIKTNRKLLMNNGPIKWN